jgi:cytochrome P450
MPTISTKDYLLDQAKRRLKPTPVTIPGMGFVEQRLRQHEFKQFPLAQPPAGSGLKPVTGDSGLPIIGHLIEFFRLGPDYAVEIYRKYGPIHYNHSPALSAVAALGPDATQAVFSNRNKEFSQRAWDPVIGPFFDRGLMLLDFDEHMFHRRIMQEAFTRSRLSGYVENIDAVASHVLANEWVPNDSRFLFHPAAKELTLDIASVVFMGHEPGTDRELVTTINQAFTTTTRAGNAIVRKPVKHLTWWRGIEALEKLETYDLVINEALRMVTPLPMNFRRAIRDTDLLGYFIPAGTDVVTWPSLNHRLPELWTNPDKFDPDRFAEPRSEHKKHRYAFAPFGGGAHKCIGMVFGQLEIKTVMHRLLRKYRLELVRPDYKPRYDYGGMPVPIDGLPIVLRPLR